MASCNCEFVIKEGEPDWKKHYNTCNLSLAEREKNGEFTTGSPRNDDGSLRPINKYQENLPNDYLYHLDMGRATHDFEALFGDVKFVCMGGTATRMKQLAKVVAKEIGYEIPTGCDLIDLTASSNRFSMYKVGPVLTVNHGIGISTMSVVLQEVIKLLQYSKAKDPIMFRIGTCGGIGVEPGSVVVSDKGFDGMLNDTYDVPILAKMVKMPAILDKRLAQELCAGSQTDDEFQTIHAHTVCTNCFYNGQGRTDGPFCEYTEDDKFKFLNKLYSMGVRNFEMEVTCFAALTYKAGMKAADICVTFLDRLKGDQVVIPKNLKIGWEDRPMHIAIRYIKQYLKNTGQFPYKK